MAVVGGVASPAGAVLGALYIQGSRWFLPIEWQLLASGFGILLVLLIVPGGLGGLALRCATSGSSGSPPSTASTPPASP